MKTPDANRDNHEITPASGELTPAETATVRRLAECLLQTGHVTLNTKITQNELEGFLVTEYQLERFEDIFTKSPVGFPPAYEPSLAVWSGRGIATAGEELRFYEDRSVGLVCDPDEDINPEHVEILAEQLFRLLKTKRSC